jgi:hypothetical protein
MRNLFMVGVLGMALAATAQADQPAQPPAKKPVVHHKFVDVCKADAKKLCGDVEPGDGRIAQCLAEHKAEIGKKCTVALRRAKRVAMFRAACGADVKSLCPDVKPGAGRIHQCLKTHEATLSETCKTRLTSRASKKAVADVAAVADEAVTEERQSVEPLPETLPIEAEAPVGDPAITPEPPAPTCP